MTAVADRLWAKVDKQGDTDSCWLWTAGIDRQGYGRVKVEGVSRLAHRVAHWLRHGTTEGNLHHLCETPRCVNPAHLIEMTHGQHSFLHRTQGGLCRKGHDNWGPNGATRACRTCKNERKRMSQRSVS